MKGRIEGWKTSGIRLIVAKESNNQRFKYEYIDSRNELYNEEVVIMLGDIDAGTYYLYADINDYKDDTQLPTSEYSVRVYSAQNVQLEKIDQPEGFIDSVMGSCVFKTQTLKPLAGNDIKYYYGWAAKCGYLAMLYVNDSST